jgi:ribosomal protein L17
MIITTHQQLEENRKALQKLIATGKDEQEYMTRRDAIVCIKYPLRVTLFYSEDKKEEFFRIERLQECGCWS